LAGIAGLLLALPAAAQAQYLLIGDDNKLHWDDAGKPVLTAPGTDEVVIVDIRNREAPKIVASLPLMNTVIGPPTNLAITPDEGLALVANSLAYQQDGAGWKSVPDTKLFVIDLQSRPPKLVSTVEVGKQPSGLVINRKGDLVLIANRADASVNVLTIKGKEVKLVDTVAMGDPVSAVAFTPDGKHALVTKYTVNKVALLDIDSGKASYNKANDMAVGVWPYNIQITADGHYGLTVNQGNGGVADGGAGSVTVIDLKAMPPHVVDSLGVGPSPEGFEVSPKAPLAVALALNGSGGVAKGAWFARKNTIVEVLSTAGGKVRKIGAVNAGGLAEGIAFSPDGKYLYVANFIESNLQIYKVTGGKIVDTGKSLPLPGHPASMRSSVP
jgi:DNA-binding beta-propeller fold protein YncE